LHVGHQAVGILPETHIYQLIDRLGLQRLAEHRQQMPLPLAAQERLGQILQMLPTFSLVIVAPTGGKEMKMGMVLPIATMRVEDCEVASPQCFAPDLTREII
jgi:hypothetical protein